MRTKANGTRAGVCRFPHQKCCLPGCSALEAVADARAEVAIKRSMAAPGLRLPVPLRDSPVHSRLDLPLDTAAEAVSKAALDPVYPHRGRNRMVSAIEALRGLPYTADLDRRIRAEVPRQDVVLRSHSRLGLLDMHFYRHAGSVWD